MKNKSLTLVLVILMILASSCHTLKPFTTAVSEKETAALKVIKLSQISARRLKENYIVHADYQDNTFVAAGIIDCPSNSRAKITATSNFGLPLARITITTDSAFVHSMLFEDYSVRNSSLLRGTGFSISPATLKDILLGNLIFVSDTISLDNYNLSLQNDSVVILQFRIPFRHNASISSFNNTVAFSLNLNKVISNSFWLSKNETQIIIKYLDFSTVNNKKIPNKIDFTIVQGIDTTMIAHIKIKNIRLQ